MIFSNSVTNAVYTILSSAETLVNSGVVIELYGIENTNPNNTLYWIGILPVQMDISPWRSQIVSPWKASYTIPLITQVQAYDNVEDRFQPFRELDDLNSAVFTAINSYRTLFDTVNIVNGWSFTRRNADDILSDDFLMYDINISAEVFA